MGAEKPHRGKALFKCPVIKAHAHREQVTEGIKAVELTSSLYFKAQCHIDLGEVSAGKGLALQAPPRASSQPQTPWKHQARQLALATPLLRKVRWADPWAFLARLPGWIGKPQFWERWTMLEQPAHNWPLIPYITHARESLHLCTPHKHEHRYTHREHTEIPGFYKTDYSNMPKIMSSSLFALIWGNTLK